MLEKDGDKQLEKGNYAEANKKFLEFLPYCQ